MKKTKNQDKQCFLVKQEKLHNFFTAGQRTTN